MQPDIQAELHFQPFELNPHMGPEGQDISEHLTEKYGSTAQQQAQSYTNQARAYALQLTAKAQGEAVAFDKVYEQYKLAPVVTRRRMYYETMERVLQGVDKTIVDAPGVNNYQALPPVVRSPPQGAAK